MPYRRGYSRRPVVRRRPIRRRRAYSAPSRARRFGDPHANASLRIYKDPFAVTTANAKIPDGKAVRSVGLRHQTVTPIAVPETGTITLVIYPGLTSGVVTSTGNVPLYQNGMSWTAEGDVDSANDFEAPTFLWKQSDTKGISYWRTVSQACKFALINNSDENDGWWESARIRPNHDPHEYNMTIAQTGLDSKSTLHPNSTSPYENAVGELVDQPSYRTGKLRDIHRVGFSLKPHMRDHDFKPVPHAVTSSDIKWGPTDGSGISRPFAEGSHTAQAFLNSNIDDSWDVIVIRIHGRTGTGTSTNLVMHSVANHEYTYNLSSPLSVFQTPGHNHPGFSGAKRAAVSQPDGAAMPLAKKSKSA